MDRPRAGAQDDPEAGRSARGAAARARRADVSAREQSHHRAYRALDLRQGTGARHRHRQRAGLGDANVVCHVRWRSSLSADVRSANREARTAEATTDTIAVLFSAGLDSAVLLAHA